MGTSSAALPLDSSTPSRSRFATYAWVVLGYTLLVILYGAWVRISGSGAGCGDHWPTCNGEIVPPNPSTKTLIEYGHRLTSGILGPMTLVLVGWAWFDRRVPRATRFWAVLTLVFVLFEALLGAGLVLAELVADDASGARAVVISLHLVNTLILTAATALTAWVGAGHAGPRLSGPRFPHRTALLFAVVGLVLVSATGAVTALGDTLFPVQAVRGGGLWDRVSEDLSPSSHFLVRLRAVHPALATGIGIYVAALAQRFVGQDNVLLSRLGYGVAAATWAQLSLGGLNIALSAPGWLQLGHLLGAQVVWVFLILLWAQAGQSAEAPPDRAVAPAQ